MDNFFIITTVWQLLHIFWLCLYLMSKMITLDAYVLEMWNFARCIWQSDQINLQRDRRGHIYINFITHNSTEFMDFNNFWWRVWDFILNMNSLSSEIIAIVLFFSWFGLLLLSDLPTLRRTSKILLHKGYYICHPIIFICSWVWH